MGKRVLFGTDGIRGKANLYPMTCELAMALGRAVTSYFQSKKSNRKPVIIIGKDTRISCYMLEQAFSAGVCSQGGRGILTGPLPTPGVAFVIKSMRADAGVMISASHNEYSDNGIKIFDADGNKLPDSVEAELEKLALSQTDLDIKINDELGSTTRLDEVIGRYIVHAKSSFNPELGLEGLRIVVDCANGAAYKAAPMIFSELGADVIPLGTSPNGKNINEYSGAMHPEFCAENVLKYRADIGICLDGDADRVIVVDGHGQVVDGDKIIGLCSRFLKDQGKLRKKTIVGTVMSNIGLDLYLKSLGIKFERTKVGDRYIVEKMRKENIAFGGEPSGHVIFSDFSTTGDGIITALKIIEAMLFYQKPIKDLVDEIKLYPQILKNVMVKMRPPLEEIKAVMDAKEKAEKKLNDRGRIVLRYSGTEPLVRIMVEGEHFEMISEIVHELETVLKKELT